MNSRLLVVHKQYLSQQVGATCWLKIIIMEPRNPTKTDQTQHQTESPEATSRRALAHSYIVEAARTLISAVRAHDAETYLE